MGTGPTRRGGLRPRADRDPRRRAPLPRRGRAASAAPRCSPTLAGAAGDRRPTSTRPARGRRRARPSQMGRTLDVARPARPARAQPRAPALGRRSPSAASPAATARWSARPASAPSVEDVNDLTGERRRALAPLGLVLLASTTRYIHGGSVRPSARARYRQWLTHKFGTWHRPVRHARAASAAGAASPGARSASTSPRSSPRSVRPTGRWTMQTLDELVAREPGLRRASTADAARADRRLRLERRLRGGRAALPRGRRRPTPSTSLRHGTRRARRRYVPAAATSTIETLEAGRGGRLVVALPAVPRGTSTRARSTTCGAIAFDGACLRGKCDDRPRARLRADAPLRAGHDRPAAATRDSGSSTSMATAAAAEPAAAGAMAPRAVPRRRAARGDGRHVDARARAARGDAGRPGARASSHALRLRRRRGADLDERRADGDGALVHTIRAVGAVTRALCAARARRRARRARAVRQRLAARRGGRRRPRRRRRRDRPRAAPARALPRARAPRRLRRGRPALGAAPRPTRSTAASSSGWRGRFDARGGRHRRRADAGWRGRSASCRS